MLADAPSMATPSPELPCDRVALHEIAAGVRSRDQDAGERQGEGIARRVCRAVPRDVLGQFWLVDPMAFPDAETTATPPVAFVSIAFPRRSSPWLRPRQSARRDRRCR